MNTRLIISLSLIAGIIAIFIIKLFVQYRRGVIERNPLKNIREKESRILYYAFFKWRAPQKKAGENQFFLHTKSNYFWFFLALMHEQIIEMGFLHIYIKQTDPLLANIISALHIYSVIYIMGDYNWVRNTPITVGNHIVNMKIGARRELNFHINDIAAIQKAAIQYNKSGGIIHEKGVFHATAFPRVLTRVFGMNDELKYEIIFNRPLQARGYFGQKQEVSKALVYIERADDLVELLKAELEISEDLALKSVGKSL